MIHRLAYERIAPGTASTFDMYALLWSEDSTAALTPADMYVAAGTPGANELVCDGYERTALDTVDFDWVTDHQEVTAGTVNFGALASEHTGHGISGVAVFVKVGDGTNDSLNWLVRSWTLDDVVELTGEDVVLAWDASGVWTVGD